MIYPWQKNLWQHLAEQKKVQRLPHALLLTGMAGLGKRDFAHHFTRALLCQQSQEDAFTVCASKTACHACRLIETGVHPNILWIEPEKKGQAIKVDQIRAINEFNAHSALQGQYKVILVNPAHQMNSSAANALLKTLEEPTPGTIIVLLSAHKKRLPATILSRCQLLTLLPPDEEIGIAWLQTELKSQLKTAEINLRLLLKLADGAPLLAASLIQKKKWQTRSLMLNTLCELAQKKMDPIAAAVILDDFEMLEMIDFVLGWQRDMLSLKLCNAIESIVNLDYQERLQQISSKLQVQTGITLMNVLQKLRKQCCIGFNLNKQLTFESILIQYQECFTPCS